MNTVIKVLEIAEEEIGYLEKKDKTDLYSKTGNAGSNNFTKYWKDLGATGMQGEPWCNAFVNWCFEKAYGSEAKHLLCTPGLWSYYTPTSANYFMQAGRWYKTPVVGDIVYFKNDKRICHVGIVIEVNGNTITTIEGNTSSAVGVIPNGGGVFKKYYTIPNSRIAGFGRPDYDVVMYNAGWNHDAKGWWYADSSTTYLKDTWKVLNHCKYYFDSEGYAVTGEQTIDGKRYYFEPTPGAAKECALLLTNEHGELYLYEE